MAAVYKRHDEVALRIIQAGATPHLQDKVGSYYYSLIVINASSCKQNHTNAILLAIATNEQDRVVEALLERVEDPSQLDLQDSVGLLFYAVMLFIHPSLSLPVSMGKLFSFLRVRRGISNLLNNYFPWRLIQTFAIT